MLKTNRMLAVAGILLLSVSSASNANILGFSTDITAPTGGHASNDTWEVNAGNQYNQAGGASIASDTLRICNPPSGDYTWGSGYALTQQLTINWTSNFTLTYNKSVSWGDTRPLSFSLQTSSQGAAALSWERGTLQGGATPLPADIAPIAGLAFDCRNNRIGVFTDWATHEPNVASYSTVTGVTIGGASGTYTFDVALNYSGGTLGVTLTQGANTYTNSYSLAMPDTNAYVGFFAQNGGSAQRYTVANFDYTVPEPGTLALLAFGSMAILKIRRKKHS